MLMILFSCTNGLKPRALKHMKSTIKELAKNPDSMKLTNIETAFNNDSLCVIHFIGKGQNGFGGYSSSHFEYIFIKIRDGKDPKKITYAETLLDLDENNEITGEQNESIMKEMSEDDISSFKALAAKYHKNIKDEDIYPTYLYNGAVVLSIVEGREIDAEK